MSDYRLQSPAIRVRPRRAIFADAVSHGPSALSNGRVARQSHALRSALKGPSGSPPANGSPVDEAGPALTDHATMTRHGMPAGWSGRQAGGGNEPPELPCPRFRSAEPANPAASAANHNAVAIHPGRATKGHPAVVPAQAPNVRGAACRVGGAQEPPPGGDLRG